MAHKITIGNLAVTTTGNDITVSGTFTTAAGVAITTGTVTFSMYRTDGSTALTGVSFPVSMSHVAAGVWTAVLQDTLVWPTPSKVGKCVFTAIDGSGNKRTKSVRVTFDEDNE